MSFRSEPVQVYLDYKTGKEISVHLQGLIPRIGDSVITDKRAIYEVVDVVFDSYWNKRKMLATEIRIFLKYGKGKK